MKLNTEEHRRMLIEQFGVSKGHQDVIVALAGNPNVGKSTIFNALTGLRQHTGNWPGKTVDNAQGRFSHRDKSFLLIDLPGTYSLMSHSMEEQVARDFLCFAHPDVTIVVVDATCLERNLNLALQIMEITSKVVVCVNLMDEARKKNIYVDTLTLQKQLGVPVVATSARNGEGLNDLSEILYQVITGLRVTNPKQIVYSKEIEAGIQQLMPKLEGLIDYKLNPRWLALRLLDGDKSIIDSITHYLEIQKHFQGLQEDAV